MAVKRDDVTATFQTPDFLILGTRPLGLEWTNEGIRITIKSQHTLMDDLY